MKLSYYKFFTIFVLSVFLSANFSFAEKATKRVDRTFNINSNTKIEIHNQFGNVVINKWDRNVLDLKVTIEAEGKSESKAQKILDAIEVDISDRISSGSLKFETEIGNITGNSSFSVHYEITMPNTNPLEVSNNFGGIYMRSHKGDLDIEVKYGQFQAEDIDRAKIRVDFSKSRCEIETLKSGFLDLRHSKVFIEEAGDVEVSSQFSDLEVEEVGVIELNGKYRKLELGRVKVLKGDIQFAELDIEYLEESLVLENQHGDGINIQKVSSDFKEIDIDGQFCSIELNLEEDTKAQLRFDLQFGNLKAFGDGINFNRVIKENNSSEYEGFLGDQNATASIKVNSRHGNIKLNVGR